MTFEEWFEENYKIPFDVENKNIANILNVERVRGMYLGWQALENILKSDGVIIPKVKSYQENLLEDILAHLEGIKDNEQES